MIKMFYNSSAHEPEAKLFSCVLCRRSAFFCPCCRVTWPWRWRPILQANQKTPCSTRYTSSATKMSGEEVLYSRVLCSCVDLINSYQVFLNLHVNTSISRLFFAWEMVTFLMIMITYTSITKHPSYGTEIE